MFIGDIALDENGNTIIMDGLIDITYSNINFIIRSLTYALGSWTLTPTIGLGIDRFIGKVNGENLRTEMRNIIYEYFQRFGIDLDVSIIPVTNNSVACQLFIVAERIPITFIFDINSGLILFSDIPQISEDEDDFEMETRVSPNKYLFRR